MYLPICILRWSYIKRFAISYFLVPLRTTLYQISTRRVLNSTKVSRYQLKFGQPGPQTSNIHDHYDNLNSQLATLTSVVSSSPPAHIDKYTQMVCVMHTSAREMHGSTEYKAVHAAKRYNNHSIRSLRALSAIQRRSRVDIHPCHKMLLCLLFARVHRPV